MDNSEPDIPTIWMGTEQFVEHLSMMSLFFLDLFSCCCKSLSMLYKAATIANKSVWPM